MKIAPVTTTLSQKDFIQISFTLLYKKLAIRLLTIIAAGFFLMTLVLFIYDPNKSGSSFLTATTMLLALPGITYFNAKKTYTLNARLSETVSYTFDDRFLSMKGASFNSEVSWDKLYKVTRSKNWLLIWQTKDFANAIRWSELQEDQLQTLKTILVNNRVTHHF